MAFTRKAVAAIEGISPAQVDAIMTLHGTSMADYLPKSEIDAQVQTKLTEQLGGLNIETLKTQAAKAEKLEGDLANIKLDHALDGYLAKAGAVNTKAVKALLDMSKIKLDGDNITGHEEQVTALKESEKWAFQVGAPSRAVGPTSGPAKGADDTKSKANEGLRSFFGKGE